MADIQFEGQSVRSNLIMALPRLRRFSGVLAGDEESRDILLRESLQWMLENAQDYPPGAPFDRWAFSHIHNHWMAGLRDHNDPIALVRADESLYCPDCLSDHEDYSDAQEVGTFLASLPPQQRSAVLLIFGEKFSYEDAAAVLDATIETVTTRAVRGLAALVDRLEMRSQEHYSEAEVETLYPAESQPNS